MIKFKEMIEFNELIYLKVFFKCKSVNVYY